MANFYVLNGWTNSVEVSLAPAAQAVYGVYPVACVPGLNDISAWAKHCSDVTGDIGFTVTAGTNASGFSAMGMGSNRIGVVVESYQGQPSKIIAFSEFAGQRGAAFYSGLNVGIAAAVAAATVLYLLRAARSGSRSMISGGD